MDTYDFTAGGSPAKVNFCESIRHYLDDIAKTKKISRRKAISFVNSQTEIPIGTINKWAGGYARPTGEWCRSLVIFRFSEIARWVRNIPEYYQ